MAGRGPPRPGRAPPDGQREPPQPQWLRELLGSRARAGRILVVDDDPTFRALLQEYFSREGYEVHTAEDGLQCLGLALSLRPDLIILNFLMPRMDGLTALIRIKESPITANLKVLMFSGTSHFASFREKSLKAGALDCLQTPFSFKTLLVKAEKILGQ